MKRFALLFFGMAAIGLMSGCSDRHVPNLTFMRLDTATPVELHSLRGHPVLIDFWATWCGPCRESLPHTQKIFEDLKSKGLEVMAVSDEDPETIKQFVAENRYSFPVYRDPDSSAEKILDVDAIPTVMIIDKDGNLVNTLVGEQDEAILRAELKKVGIE